MPSFDTKQRNEIIFLSEQVFAKAERRVIALAERMIAEAVAPGTTTPVAPASTRGFVILGETVLVGIKNGSNQDYTLPSGKLFYLDANNRAIGPLLWKGNILTQTDAVPGPFEYKVTSTSGIKVGIAPNANDYLAFLTLLVRA